MRDFILKEKRRPRQIDDLKGITVAIDPKMNDRRKKQYYEMKKYLEFQKNKRGKSK